MWNIYVHVHNAKREKETSEITCSMMSKNIWTESNDY